MAIKLHRNDYEMFLVANGKDGNGLPLENFCRADFFNFFCSCVSDKNGKDDLASFFFQNSFDFVSLEVRRLYRHD